jgi:NAD(P)-dependent dehydrogenase (short-subunit alcohol dehydrogenase family)
MAPLACAGAFVRQVGRSREKKMIAIGSIVGSISAAARGGYYPYRASKAALNAVWHAFAIDHPEVIAAVLHPGRMRTDMTRYDEAEWNKLASPEQRAAELCDQIARLGRALSGARVLHVNATAFGGGVAEILGTLVPLMNDVGLQADWQVIDGPDGDRVLDRLRPGSVR